MNHAKAFASSTKAMLDIIIGRLYPDIILPYVDLHGKRALVTGANVGLGKAIATSFAGQGAEVYLLCRNQQRAEEARAGIMKETGSDKVFVEILDVGSLQSVRDFVGRWSQRSAADAKIDILVNNAGLTTGTKITTVDGFEITYAVNMLGSFALTIQLLKKGYFASNARIVSVSSSGMYNGRQSRPTSLNSPDLLGQFKEGDELPLDTLLGLYGRSKALQVVFTVELQERLRKDEQYRDVVVQVCHPGNVKTSIWGRKEGVALNPTSAKWARFASETFGISLEQGAVTPVWLATSEEAAEPSLRGRHWERNGWKWIPVWMQDPEQRRIIWNLMAQDAQLEGVY